MSRPLRLEYPGSLWHITQRGNEQRDIFLDDDDRSLMLTLLAKAVERFGWILYSYTLMTNHYHYVLELTRERSLSRGMHWLDGTYAQAFNRRHKRVGHLFQGRFGSQLVDKEAYLLTVLRYVALNPVRAGMVTSPEEHAWSSYRATVGHSPAPPWLAIDRVLACFGRDPGLACAEYRRFVEAGIGDTTRPWDNVVGQVYLGTEAWIEQVRKQIDSRARSDEHPAAQRILSRPSMTSIVGIAASVFATTEDAIRHGRGGMARMLSAWLGYYEGALDLRAIAAALRLRSAGGVSRLITRCERELARDRVLQESAERCVARLRGGPAPTLHAQ